jgi:NB-ARC domain
MQDKESFINRLLDLLDNGGFSATPEVIRAIYSCDYEYDRPLFANLSREGVEPISSLIKGDYISRLKNFLEMMRGTKTKELPLVTQNYYRPPFFLGRKGKLEELHTTLTDTESRHPIVLLNGIGGMGKTTLMLEYLGQENCRRYFHRIVLITVNKNLRTAFVEGAAEALGVELSGIVKPDDRLKAVVHKMKGCDRNNLFVVDNINEPDLDDLTRIKTIFESTGWKFLITTRTSPKVFSSIIEVVELAMPDALLLFAHHYAPDQVKRYQEDQLTGFIETAALKEPVEALLTHILRHTLLTELLAKFAKLKGMKPAALLDLLKNSDYRNPVLERIIPTGAYAEKTFRLSKTTLHNYLLSLFETEYLLVKTGNDLADNENEHRATMLRFFSVLPPADIPVEDLKMLWRVEPTAVNTFEDRLDVLQEMGWIQHKQVLVPEEEVIQNLAYKMHPLVQEVVHEKLKPDDDNCAPLMITVKEILEGSIRDASRYRAYAQSILDKLELLDDREDEEEDE